MASILPGPIPELDAVLLWSLPLEANDTRIVGATAPITGEVPAEFALELLAPPPQAVRGGSRWCWDRPTK